MPFDLPPITRALLIANVAIYLLQMLTGDALITTTEIYGDAPVAFSWHPFLRLPGEPREEWRQYLALVQ